MSSSSRIPPLLEGYLALPPEYSLVLLTSVLGASSNWLLLRHLYSYLKGGDDVGVVLVSFMRDGAFWREGASRLGLDLDAMTRSGRVAIVDGLTGPFNETPPPAGKDRILRGVAGVDNVREGLESALGDVQSATKVLMVDQLDVLLAASEDGGDFTSASLSAMLLSLRERVHSTVLTMSADAPLVHAQSTTLEREHAALVLGQAHASGRVMALRMLDTGSARDVSGVVRITGRISPGEEDDGREYLYFVAGDGTAKVFERGA